MTILSRHPGIEATTTDKLLAHLTDALIPRVKPFLDRLKAEERRREQERFMRAEQDRAYREAMNRDKERIERKIREEQEEKRRVHEKKIAEEKRLKAEGEERKRKEEWDRKRMEWRRYLRWLSKADPAPSAGLRIGIRMPDGTRGIRIFGPRDSLTALYGFVDSHFIPSEFLVADDPTSPPSSSSSRGEAAVHGEIARSSLPQEQWWRFQLATSYPRKEIPWQQNATLGGISGLESGVQLVVEIVRHDDSKKPRESLDSRNGLPPSTNASEVDDDSDDYDTESDDE